MIKFSKIFLALIISGISALAQTSVIPNSWHMMDKEADGYSGVSANKAYEFLKSKNLKSKTVIVAVIDTGIDTLHEDLKSILWNNPKEIPANGKDDDGNGYIDDVHGWNFLGGKDGRNVKVDSDERGRVYYGLKDKWDNKEVDKSKLSKADLYEYEMFVKAKAEIKGTDSKEDEFNDVDVPALKALHASLLVSDSILKKGMNRDTFTGNELDQYVTKSFAERRAKTEILTLMKNNNMMDQSDKEFIGGLLEYIEYIEGEQRKAQAKVSAPKTYRKDIVGDDENNFNDNKYGNSDIMADFSMHGTHCAGIIGAARNNGKGMDGIADNVRIMSLRVVPDGDEHDKDIALAIRYAVDNGAQIISMSFGKSYSPQKVWVDEAFAYAESKNVLLVHAAGNDNKDVDVADNFPNPNYVNGGRASNVITVGASAEPLSGKQVATFSNYGKKEVDVFSPGAKIYSTLPGGNNYGNLSGTSMACPLVAGIAALTLEYFPGLSAKQLKYVIEKSAIQPKGKVNKPGTEDEKVAMSELSRTGGIVNAYEAVKLAATLTGENKNENLPKPTMTKPKKG
ncbi:MAG: S8 family serine peptidase [Chitinophagaceae bacterium]|nr:S8 family serine peptidase [Chitinophagaceae bacterium]MBL0201079.1 S8 family serine peptidase [Chitinophagaceae bacterium]